MSEAPLILGAGVAGLAVAAELASRGAPFRISDPAGAPGPHHCSWWAGGMLAPFCESETAEEPVTRLGQQAADWWERMGARVERRGSLVVTPGRDAGELERFARRTQGHEWLDADALAALEPDLAGRFRRALWFPGEAHLSPRDALGALLRRAGAVTAPENAGAAERVIDCRGLAAADELEDLRGVRGEMLVLKAPEITLSRPVRLLHPRHPLYIVPRGDGVFMLGATQLESASRGPATVRSLLELLNSAYALSPAFAEAEVLETGADARPAFPDHLPRIRRRGQKIYVNGLFRHGFLLAPALARMVADYLEAGARPEFMDEETT